MVITMSQSSSNNQSDRFKMEENSYNNSNIILLELNSRNQNIENNGKRKLNHEKDHERGRIVQRFNDIESSN